MVGNNSNIARKTNAYFAVLVLALAAPLAVAVGGTLGATAGSNATLEAFADGTVSKTIAFGAGAESDSSVYLRLPRDAAVARASLDAGVAGDSAVSSGAMVFDVGADGSADATASVSVLGKTRVELPPAALDAYLDAQGGLSASVDVPVKVTGAAAAEWSVVLDGLKVEYNTNGSLGLAPGFVGEISAVAVVAGETNYSAVDLGAHFTADAGESLRFSAQVTADAQAAAADVSVIINGTRADVRSSNPDFWGEVVVRFAAADTQGEVAISNEVTVHVVPRPVTVPTVKTESRLSAEAVLIAGCGAPAPVERFEIPADAIVTEATMSLEGAIGLDVLGATIDILAGAEAAAGVNASDLPREIELNTSALNTRLRTQASAFGLVELDLSADVCPSGSITGLAAANISVTYVRGATNLTAPPAQVIASIAIEGETSGSVGSDSGLTLSLETNGTLEQGAEVEWFVDGELVATGSTAENVMLCQGEHTVEARATSGLSVVAYQTTVNATSDAEAEAQIAINGIVTTAVESGAALILELRTPRPLSADATVEWYIDGAFAGRGQVLADVQLATGVHTVEARETSSGSVHTSAAQVTAHPATQASNLLAALAVSGALAVVAAGALAVRRRR